MFTYNETIESFKQTSEHLLQIMGVEKDYLQNTQLTELNTILEKKSDLFKQNQHYADMLLDPLIWAELDFSQREQIICFIEQITKSMEYNLYLLDIASKGNKNVMELYFHRNKRPSTIYAPNGKLCDTRDSLSVGVQHEY